MSEGRFSGQTVLITGAAGGFGALAAKKFAAEGARLALSDVSEAALAAVADEIRASGTEVFGEQVDVSREDQVARHIANVLDRFGRLDVAVNNAGIAHAFTPLHTLPVETFDRMMAVNARGVFLGMKHQLPPMLDAGRGVILNVASAAGLVGAGHLAAYAAAKHAIVGLTRSAADEVAREGIRINALCPSFAATPMFDELSGQLEDRHALDRTGASARITARVPMGRVVTAEEVVDAMLWLCSPQNSAMTGQAVAIDGGLTAI